LEIAVTTAARFPIVGVGASAGGVEALEGLFRGLPDSPGLALVIVTHLSPGRESLLHEIISYHTRMPVHVAADNMVVEPNNVYVLPADAVLNISDGRLFIRKPSATHRERKPIDIFLSSLASDQADMAVGIILSGGDSDGTLGIKAIKERGGLTMAQTGDGYGPEHPDMPASAISAGFVDLALPAEQMGPKLVDFVRDLPLLGELLDSAGDAAEDASLAEQRAEICAILRNQIGHDFSGYKSRTFMRRVHRRMQVVQLDNLVGYVEMLRRQPSEVSALFRDLLINVTNFFRDAEAFESLAVEVMPKIFEGRGADDIIRVWVPGCSTGEEVYSLGMLMREHMDTLTAVPRVQIFATDIDDRALAVARAARYPSALLDGVSPERRARHFYLDGGSYVVAKDIRELCVFSPHSVIRDPPFSHIDLISCRNLLIYFGADVQNQIIPTFHYALRPNGFLFLGAAENISQFDDLFVAIDKKHRLFRQRSEGVPGVRLPFVVNATRIGQLADLSPRRITVGGLALRQSVEAQVLERFSPPHVVVGREGDVVFYSSRTGKYLEAAPGAPNRQIMAMARRGLRLELRTALKEAVDTGRPIVRENVAVEGDDGRVQMIRLIVEPLADRNGADPLYLILFDDDGPTLSRDEAVSRPSVSADGASTHLDQELRETRERLQATIEEYETALEELKSSNEELVSVNEELQSANEEMEASKEELQSVNEELHTVNIELNSKVVALDQANGDLRNLFESTDVATIFLDHDLLIRSFTPAAGEVINILPGDCGRPITDLAIRFDLASFSQDIAAVLAGGERVERRVKHRERDAHFLLRIAPYRDRGIHIDGVVVTLIDISTLVQAEQRQEILISELQHRTRNLLAIIQSIARRTWPDDDRLSGFNERLASIGRVQGMISRPSVEEVAIRDMIVSELRPIATLDANIVSIDGPDVSLRLQQVQIFVLALHELTTNALKYGAFKHPTGRLAITWAVEPAEAGGEQLAFNWVESGVPMPPDASAGHGYGRELIEKALVYSLKASAALTFRDDGISCRIVLPLPRGDDAKD
jgi:two-component system, chemotaxis family, CheB/CheR fusion protein